MTFRKVGRIAIDLLAGALVLTAIASLTGVPARFADRTSEGGTSGNEDTYFVQQAGSTTAPAPACERPMLIGKVVVSSVAARRWPSRDAPAIATFRKVNPQGATQVFDLEGSVLDSGGTIWFRALLPIRPNGTSGYIPAGSVRILQTSYRIVVDREALRLTLWKGCRQVMKLKIGLGKESTPMPNGDFYIVSLLKPPVAQSIYGKYAYGLSAFSNAITDWKGGGVIGLHGTNDPSSIGNRKSHGCIRLYNWDISKLVPLLPLGTPVEIR
jgi:lipoprotein-anchoring transpeptidase ErfK/SrfK